MSTKPPMDVPCPACKAKVGQHCDQPEQHNQRYVASTDVWLASLGYKPLGKGAS